ncbi:MAG: hypothetical protein HOC71_04125 [Candidatus Latescibacteria bacterium]|jgi:hypothetical protein|nr:hypothetical protein [Candidatus Latescibacterota bacterium]
MFVGHYGVGFLLKKRFNEIPLWLLFISVQFVDILAFSFVLLGIEIIKYNPSANPFLRTIIEYVPYSHSLFANLILSFTVFLIFWRIKNKLWGIALSIGVLSHWFLDILVHVSDMPLFHNSLKVGMGLWKFPLIAFIIEFSMFILAGFFLLKSSHKIKRHIFLIILLSISFGSMYFSPEAEATAAMASIFSLTLYTVFTALAYWCDRGKN